MTNLYVWALDNIVLNSNIGSMRLPSRPRVLIVNKDQSHYWLYYSSVSKWGINSAWKIGSAGEQAKSYLTKWKIFSGLPWVLQRVITVLNHLVIEQIPQQKQFDTSVTKFINCNCTPSPCEGTFPGKVPW